METLLQDIRYACRRLLKNPGFTAVMVLVLAVGIGANTVMFSLVNAVLFRPLPYKDPDQLVYLWEEFQTLGLKQVPVSVPEFVDFRDQAESFEHIAAFNSISVNLATEAEPERIEAALVSHEFFPLLGVRPMSGRTFRPEEDQPGGEPVVVVSSGLWQSRFGSDPNFLGGRITLNGRSHSVIGIMPPSLQFPPAAEIWAPLALSVDQQKRGLRSLSVIARLKDGVSLKQAQAQMNSISSRIRETHPKNYEGSGWQVKLVSLLEHSVGNIETPLLLILGAVGLVLLIACANVANLLLARAASRHKEIAIRTAIGAGRLRLIRQLLTESAALTLLGGGLGLLFALFGNELLVYLRPSDIPRIEEVSIDGWVLAFTLIVSILTGVIFGLAPALRTSKASPDMALREGSRGSSVGAGQRRIANLLVIAEVALALVLAAGAGLLLRSFLQLQQLNPGFNPENVWTAQIALPRTSYPEDQQQQAFCEQMLQRLKVLPGVQYTGTISNLPFAGIESNWSFMIEGQPPQSVGKGPSARLNIVGGDYFRAMEIPLQKGRYFSEGDTGQTEKVVVIDTAMARRFWPNEDPIGKQIRLGGADSTRPWLKIIGIVGSVKHRSLEGEFKEQMYLPSSQSPLSSMAFVLRSMSDPKAISSAVRKEIFSLDRALPLFNIETMEQVIGESLARRRLSMTLLNIFAGLALALATLGIYSVRAYSVTQQMREFGIRLALGARPQDVLTMVMKQGMILALIGIGIGLAVSSLISRVLSSMLYEVKPLDLRTFAAVALLSGVVALVASYIPARRAARIDPSIVLRYE